ncbi:MAG: hypothetical protein WBE36_01710 [Terracidiphilus sp.]
MAIAIAFAFPHLLSRFFRRSEAAFARLGRRKRLACATVGASAFLLRLALLPLFPAPLPFLPNDFSFLLAADTFAHGRLANPAPLMWAHFESVHVTVQPTYTSMYFPGPGLMLAAGKVLFGHPWAGLLLTTALMCAAICWALQAWLPPTWALLGGFLAVLRLGLFSYWIDTYSGGAPLAALGGALVLGAFPRLTRTGRMRYGVLMALGIAMLILTRPYEGMLLCIPVAIALGIWIFRGKNRLPALVLVRRAALPLAMVVATLAWLGYYNYRAFGNPRTLPYTVDRTTYAVVPLYVWQAAHPTPVYSTLEMRRYYIDREAQDFYMLHRRGGWLLFYYEKLSTTLLFLCGTILLPPLIMFGRVFRDRRMRFFAWSLPFWMAGMGLSMYMVPHYLAPFTVAAYVLGLQALRHLRAGSVSGAPVGRTFVRLTVTACVIMAGLRAVSGPLRIAPPEWPNNAWEDSWIGPGHFGAERAAVAQKLDKIPGNHLVLVHYAPDHEPMDQWVYNDANLSNSRTIWASDLDPQSNEELMRFYNDRDVWMVQPDVDGGKLTPSTASRSLFATRPRKDAALSPSDGASLERPAPFWNHQ